MDSGLLLAKKVTSGERTDRFCGVHIEKNVAVLYITKNANSTFRKYHAQSKEWYNMLTVGSSKIKADTRFCVILRDPAERFLSAFNMYLANKFSPGKIQINKVDQDFVLKTSDVNFELQTSFLRPVAQMRSNNPIDYFYMKPGVIQDISEFYDLSLDGSIVINPNSYRVVTDVDQDIIKSAYKIDYDLINTVEFVNHKF